MNRKGKMPWYVYFIGAAIYTALAGLAVRRIVCLWHGFASSVRHWGFTMPGGLGNKRSETEVMPNAVLERDLVNRL